MAGGTKVDGVNNIHNSLGKKNKIINYNKIPLKIKSRPYLIMLPALAITIGILYPFALAIFYSLTNYTFTSPVYKFIGLKNWINTLASADFWHALLVTFEYGVSATVVEMLLGLSIALLLAAETRYNKILKVVLIFPLMIAPVIATLIWTLMTNTSVGILEKFLNVFGIFNFPWAASSNTAMFTAVLIDVWVYTPFVMLLILAGVQSLPKSPFEAAKIDGGSTWFTFKNLKLPLLKPFLYIALIFRFMAALQEFTIIYSLTKGGPGNTLMNLSLTAYDTGFYYKRFGAAMPYILILWVIIYFVSKKLVSNWQKVQKSAAGN